MVLFFSCGVDLDVFKILAFFLCYEHNQASIQAAKKLCVSGKLQVDVLVISYSRTTIALFLFKLRIMHGVFCPRVF